MTPASQADMDGLQKSIYAMKQAQERQSIEALAMTLYHDNPFTQKVNSKPVSWSKIGSADREIWRLTAKQLLEE